VDADGATLLPGLVDSHTHVFELGALLERVNLIDVATPAEAIERVAARAAQAAPGEWIVGAGWDEGAWANAYPDKRALSLAVPDNPVYLRSLHGFAGWVNQAALDALGITADMAVPVGGELRLGDDGEPSGLFLNRALALLDGGLPPPSLDVLERRVLAALERMAADGYVAVHEAGVDADGMTVLERLEAADRLPLRVYAMLSLRDEPLMRRWLERGPDSDADSMLVTRAVKAYYDGALGSRGARLLDDYADRPGYRGVSGDGYGFNQALSTEAMLAGFQIAVHAIGDAGNREALDIFENVFRRAPATANNRHRIEHAQVLHPADIPRLAQLGIIALCRP
ncbi:MAG: amidohydrolase family protein, partial [Pseudomonadota bacterium]